MLLAPAVALGGWVAAKWTLVVVAGALAALLAHTAVTLLRVRPRTAALVVAGGPTFAPVTEEHVKAQAVALPYKPGAFFEREPPPLLAVVAATVLNDPDRFVGQDLTLAADVLSIDECRAIWREVTGRPPRRFPMPVWLFERLVGTDETTMYRWLASHEVDLDTQPALELHPEALGVHTWLNRNRGPRSDATGAARPAT